MRKTRRRSCRRNAAGAMIALAAVAAPPSTAAQDQEPSAPLLKAELVRMLALGDYSTDEVVYIVRMSCVSFRPTERDRGDLLELPAGDAVLDAIDRCRSSGQAAGFKRGIPRARTVAAGEAPSAPQSADLSVARIPEEPLGDRPTLMAPRFTMIVDERSGSLTSTEVPPRLDNWEQVADYLLQRYRPGERHEGKVVLRVRVDESGRPADSLLVESSGDPQLDAAALATVAIMRFTPAMSRDRRVAAWTELPIAFETP